MSNSANDVRNVLLCGVGGQGIILSSKILAAGLIEAGYDVKMSEVHGMAQRGGSVTTQVRYGTRVDSPIIGDGTADIIVSFEIMETARWLGFLKKGGKLVVNNFKIASAPILSGAAAYPDGIIEDLKSKAECTVIEASEIAEELGNPKVMNVIIVGSLVKALGLLDKVDWEKVIKANVKEKFHDINLKAFKRGAELV